MTERGEYIGGIRKELKEAFETLDTLHEKLCNISELNISELAYRLHNLEANDEPETL